jgi:small subunit ribosomal protein S11
MSEDKKLDRVAIINIYTTFNNTIVNLTDLSGKCIARVTGGMMTKQDRLKANPTNALFIAKRIGEIAKEKKINSFYVRIRAKTGNTSAGPGAHACVKSLIREGFKIINISEVTKMPRGGPKKKGGRRGRRV